MNTGHPGWRLLTLLFLPGVLRIDAQVATPANPHSLSSAPAASVDYSRRSVAQLIDGLTQIDSLAPGIDSAAMYHGFIADDDLGSMGMGVLGVPPPGVPPQMRELVRRGPLALPELMKHLDDNRPTKLEVGNKDPGSWSGQVGVDVFMFTDFGEEYDPRSRRSLTDEERNAMPPPVWKDFQGRYTVKVGDVCYALIGQIVNRYLFAARYQASAGLIVNSPIQSPVLAEKVRMDWGNADAEMLKASLLADIHAASYRTQPALARLRRYFPDTYNALEGDDLKKKKEFEEQEAKRQSQKQR
jgi:hypothetical protein